MFQTKYSASARKSLKSLDRVWQKRIVLAIEELAKNPYQKSNVKKLVNSAYYRLRVGNYRIIFDLQSQILTIAVIQIKKREAAYE